MKKLKHLYTLALLLSAMLLLTACEINLDNLFPEIHITSRRPRESNAESFNWNYEFTDSEELTSQSETSHEYDPSSNYVSSDGVSSETPSVSVDPEPPVVPEPISSETFISSSCISSEAPASSVEPKPPVPEPDDPQTKYEPFLLQIRHGTFPAFGQVTLIKRDFNSMLEYMSRYTPASISNIECFGATYATVILEDAYGGEYTDPEIICKMFELAGKIVLGDAYLAPEKSLEYIRLSGFMVFL